MNLKVGICNGKKYLSIVKGYREQGSKKSKTKTVLSLGYLENLEKEYDDPIAHFKQVALDMTNAANLEEISVNCKSVPLGLANNRKNAGYFAISQVYHSLKLQRFIDDATHYDKAKYDENAILKMLVYSRILNPCSKKKTWEARGQFFDKMDFSLDDVYRFLTTLSRHHEKLEKHLFKNVSYDVSNLYYDITNYFFEIDKQDALRKKGVSKEHRPNPIVQMGLYMDKNGMPLSFDLYPGNKNDCETYIPSMRKMRNNLETGRVIIVADKGMNTHKNIISTILAKNGYVFSQTARGADKELKSYILDDCGYHGNDDFMIKSRVYPRMVTLPNGKQTRIDEKQVIFWSADYDRRAKVERANALIKAQKIVDNPSTLDNYGSRKYVKNGNGQNLSLDYAKIEADERFDGYYAIITSEIEKSDDEIIGIYRGLWKIEESFKITKSDFETRPVFLSREDHIKAHFMICFISLVIIRLLEEKIGGEYSAAKIIESLRKCGCSHLTENVYLFDYADEITRKLDIGITNNLHTYGQIKNFLAFSKKQNSSTALR